eukprot:CAMPEP_0184007126 /NCGR_PEP_ID=MMETSP0954-20121128/1132_1 /TAXON_ID=627963 /ORGANISM="Aplanochytrium sp, Strain PBS07" /LENGTH=306 /DNA_ID=CAMNT_0026285865 /DNA_START=467 /DNA_END=1384 /DNA_ORIENTATION=-
MAGQFSGLKGEGQKGWLYLLAAYSLNRENEDVLYNLVNNYISSNYIELALDELSIVRQSWSRDSDMSIVDELESEIKIKHPEIYRRFTKNVAARLSTSSSMAQALKEPKILLPFSTAVAKFELASQYPRLHDLNTDFYRATMKFYNEVKQKLVASQPDITDKELNHKFFQAQMDVLKSTGSYWEGFTKLDLFQELMATMREAAVKVLVAYGHSLDVARKKASHDIIFWASVHTGSSIHEPHMTEDSLIGGVYYVTVPTHSGNLELYDPRGRSGMCKQSLNNLSAPPFHRTVSITPKEGMLILFPGW